MGTDHIDPDEKCGYKPEKYVPHTADEVTHANPDKDFKD
jgi:hypothetical protein